MSKVLKWLILADIAMVATAILLGFKTRNSNDFSGLIVVYPLMAAIILSVGILVLSFLQAIKGVSTGKTLNAPKTVGSILILLGVPWLGYYYATYGQNREGLAALSIIAFVIGILGSLVLVVRFFRPRNRNY